MASRSPERRCSGLTLLEVLAAVAILGIVYTLLADWAIQGLMAEGEARRRLDATLLADRTLAEIEAGLDQGTMPPLGVSESEEDDYHVRVEVSPLDLGAAGLVLKPRESSADRRDGRRRQETAPAGQSLLTGGPNGAISSLRRVDLRVTWNEGSREVSVTRTTFGFDREAARPLLEQLDAQAASAGTGGVGVAP